MFCDLAGGLNCVYLCIFDRVGVSIYQKFKTKEYVSIVREVVSYLL